jgi:hypothetical protein
MAIPLIAAGIAARAVAKKLATRAVGGITGAGAKSVETIYKMNASSAKKQVAGYTAGLGATTGWIGSEMYKAEQRRKKTNKR